MGPHVESTPQNIPHSSYRFVSILLIVPIVLFIASQFIRPVMVFDTAQGFMALRSMLAGGPFNYVSSPDPANIANDVKTFLTWWSPGQYLVPGVFVWIGMNDGLAISLTAMIAAIIGVVGWIQIGRTFEVSRFVAFLFVFGLVTFHFAAAPFRFYAGGDVLLFAALPWSLLALLWGIQKSTAICFGITMLTAALLFFAKLSGLIAFAADVGAISAIEILSRRRFTSSLFAMWAGSITAAVLLLIFWVGRGETPITVPVYSLTWPTILFPVAAGAFSGFSLHELLNWVFLNPSTPILSNISDTSYLLGPLGLLLLGLIWLHLRNTLYRPMAACLFLIIAAYIAIFIVMYFRSGITPNLPFEERYFRYAGILSYLLLLVAIDQSRRV